MEGPDSPVGCFTPRPGTIGRISKSTVEVLMKRVLEDRDKQAGDEEKKLVECFAYKYL